MLIVSLPHHPKDAVSGYAHVHSDGHQVVRSAVGAASLLSAYAGEVVALLGRSGSGKSTLLHLLGGLDAPSQGTVTLMGKHLSRLSAAAQGEWRNRHLGFVYQFHHLLPEFTAVENVMIPQMIVGVEAADAERRANELLGKVGVGMRGAHRPAELSGGEQQRVAIARAILADPRVLILDEATSSLDSESESLIQDGLRSLRHGRTTFVIAHRLSTIQSADQILVLEHGDIVERGTHDELLALNGRYRQLYDKQYQIEKDQFINPGEDFTPDPAPGGRM